MGMTTLAAVGAVAYSHRSQVWDRDVMRAGVERDKERLRYKRRQRRLEQQRQQQEASQQSSAGSSDSG